MKEAQFYEKRAGVILCKLCPHNCKLKEGQTGICMVRKVTNGKLHSLVYGKICSARFDPIEKKPLYHFFPGKPVLSVGSFGCNFHCSFCQNWEISQTGSENESFSPTMMPEEIVERARENKSNIGIAYTYNEPTVWYEYMLETAKLAKRKGLKNVLVTNGFINKEPLEMLLESIDAFSVDLKAFTDSFYKKLTGARLQPVLESIKTICEAGKHLEITNLVISNQNDDEKEFSEMVDWIAENTGPSTVLHISKYHPAYKQNDPPTPDETLLSFYQIAKAKLYHVYLGNLRTHEGQNTFCQSCLEVVISRNGYQTNPKGLDTTGKCKYCQAEVLPSKNIA